MKIKYVSLWAFLVSSSSLLLAGGTFSRQQENPTRKICLAALTPEEIRETIGEDVLNVLIVEGRTAEALDLIKKEPTLLDHEPYDNKTPLHFAAHQANYPVAERVLTLRPIFVHAKDGNNETPLYIATMEAILLFATGNYDLSRQYQNVIRLLLQHGAQTNVTSHNLEKFKKYGRKSLQNIIDECGIEEIQALFIPEESVIE